MLRFLINKKTNIRLNKILDKNGNIIFNNFFHYMEIETEYKIYSQINLLTRMILFLNKKKGKDIDEFKLSIKNDIEKNINFYINSNARNDKAFHLYSVLYNFLFPGSLEMFLVNKRTQNFICKIRDSPRLFSSETYFKDNYYLMKSYINPNLTDIFGRTALFYSGKIYKIMEYLIENGVDVNFKDLEGKTAITYILEQALNDDDSVQLFQYTQCIILLLQTKAVITEDNIHVIDKFLLPKLDLPPQFKDSIIDKQIECPICQDERMPIIVSMNKDNDDISEGGCITVCGHFFHSKCLKRWIRYNSSCPTCRTNISNQTPDNKCNVNPLLILIDLLDKLRITSF